MRQGETEIADLIPEATVLFSDLVDFTGLSATLPPEETVKLLGFLFSQFDDLAVRCGLETIKTIGDGYMVTSGVLERRPDGAIAVAEMGLSMLEITNTAGRAFNWKTAAAHRDPHRWANGRRRARHPQSRLRCLG